MARGNTAAPRVRKASALREVTPRLSVRAVGLPYDPRVDQDERVTGAESNPATVREDASLDTDTNPDVEPLASAEDEPTLEAGGDALEAALKKRGYDVASKVEINGLAASLGVLARESGAAVETFNRLNLDYQTWIPAHPPTPDRTLTRADVMAVVGN